MSEMDMSLGDDEESPEFHREHDEHDLPNIWAMHDKENDDDKSNDEDDNDKKDNDDKHKDDDADEHQVVSSSMEEELDKPSFLRRLGRRNKHQDDDKKDD